MVEPLAEAGGEVDAALPTRAEKDAAVAWFDALRDQLCAALEAIEAEPAACDTVSAAEPDAAAAAAAEQPARFDRTPWQRPGGGGGVMGLLRGRVLAKAGVNVSVVEGAFPPAFRARIPGAAEDGRFWAAGISVVVHPRSPRAPIAHMNTRLIVTTRAWFGGGADLTPAVPMDEDTAEFHAALRAACEAAPPGDYRRYKAWCDDYFFLPHRGEPRGVGGIFFDDLASNDRASDFAFVRRVGLAFLDVYPRILRRRCVEPWTDEEKAAQRRKRARYVEFNLLWDRGTRFGIETGGNPEAVLMSLPPDAGWP